MLYLLAYADSRATGPKAWNDWSARLMAELYEKTRRILEQGRLAVGHVAQRMLRTRDRVREGAREQGLDPAWVEKRLAAMPARYVQTVDAADIVRHLHLVRGFGRELEEAAHRQAVERAARGLVALDPVRLGPNLWSVAVAARWHHGLFSTLAGVFALHDMNIFSADVFVWSDGTVLDVFTVSDPPDPLYADEYWKRIRGAVRFALTGKLHLASRLKERRESGAALRAGRTAPAPAAVQAGGGVAVAVDNESSDFYTVVEVRAPDRSGVLFDMAHVFSELGVVLHVARVATDGDMAVDAFYARDETGGKLVDGQRVEELVRALRHRLAGA
jgi:[protein-PII] uridylyltransferase